MKKLVIVACCLAICLMATNANAVNSLVVESRGFNTGQTACTLGVWLTNDIGLTGFTLPLELRSLSGGAYIANNLTTTVPFNTQTGSRFTNSPLGSADPNGGWPAPSITRSAFDVAAANSCSGPISNTFATAGNNFAPSSPDAVFFATVSQGDPAFEEILLQPGADGAARNQASFRFLFNANANAGCFEIDTCCRTPANHLVGVDVDVNEVLFTFSKGVVSIGGANCSGPPPNTAPNAICQNIQVAANGSCQGTATAAQVNNGSNDAEDGTNLILSLTPAGPYALGANPVQLIVTDQGGKADTCAATITVVDQTAPVLNCPSNITVQCSAGIPAAYANAAALITAGGTVTDNCPNPTVALLDQVSNGQSCPEVITRRYVATDGAGNKDTCTQTVTVDDTQNPVISQCNPDTTVNVPNGTPNAVVNFANLTSASDNCDQSLTYAFSPASGSTFNPGSTPVRVIVSDDCGNSDTCFFNVTVNVLPPSNTPPNAICQNVQVGTNANCQGTVTAAQVNNGSNDAQDGTNLTLALEPAGPYALGQTQVKLIVTDQGGLKDTCDATITVVDDDNPSMSCPPSITLACDNLPAPYADLAAFIAAGGTASDNCDVSLTFLFLGQQCQSGQLCEGVCTRTYRVMDDAGNFAECQQQIRVNDSIPPVLNPCPSNINVSVSAGSTDTVITFSLPGATDNCAVSNVVASPPSGSSFPLGQTTVTVIATDNCGNADTCSFTVSVTEEVADALPTALCTDVKVSADSNCQANASINNGSFDSDGGAVTVRQDPAGPYLLGQTSVTLWVKDDEGDSSSCLATVTVNDVTAPVVTCPGDQVANNDPGQCGAIVNYPAASVTDNCDDNIALVYNPVSGSFFPVGTTTVMVTATDDAGNADTCEFDVTVNDVEPPVALCPPDTLHYPGDTTCSAVPNFDLNGVGSTDNCGVATSVYTPAGNSSFPLGATQVMHVVTDSSGNADTCYFYVNVYDAAPPKVNCPGDIVVSAPFGQQSAVVSYIASASDCGGLASFNCTPASGSTFPIGQTTVWCVAEDNAGNKDSCSFTITVNEGSLEAPGPHTDIDTISFKLTCNCDTIAIPVYCVDDPTKGGSCNYYTETTAPWLSVSPSQGQAPRNVDIIACVGDLNPGSYSGWVRFRNDPGAPTDSVFVELEVNAAPFGIDVTPDTLSFTYTGDIYNDKLCLPAQITRRGCNEECWQFVGPSGDWIWVDPTSGTTPDEVEICVTPCSLLAGVYYQTLQFCPCPGKGDPNDPPPVSVCDYLVVKLTVVNPPVLVVEPTKLRFEIDCEKKALPIPVEISNGGGGVLDWNAWTLANWLTIEPDHGTALDTFYVSIIGDSILCPDVCDTLLDSICVYGNKGCALNSPQWVTVELIICPPDTSVCDSICGWVYDCECYEKSQCGLDGAIVELWSSYPDGEIIDVDTAAWGAFCLDVEPGVDYDVRIWKKGYCTDVFEDLSCEDGVANLCLKPLDFILPETPLFHDYYSTNATSGGLPILPGDVIYACDSNGIIIGLAYVELPGTYLIHVLGNIPKVDDSVDEGADPGEFVSLWLNCECPVTVNEGFVNFGNTLFDAAWDCKPVPCCELCPGWNMFSYNVYLNDYSRENVLATIDLNYDAVRSGYCDEPTSPHLESWFANRPVNDLTEVNPWHGYDIHMTATDTLCLEGALIPANTPIYLCEGWNYVPYFPLEATSMEHALSSLDGNYTNVFNLWCDNFDSYNATRPDGANDLFCLYPCRGYWIKVNRDDTLIYPTGGYDCTEPTAKMVPSYSSGLIKGSPVVADFWSNSGLNAGDIIEVYSESGMLIGEAQAGANGLFLLHVFGDVPSTSTIEGAQDGEELTFRVNGLAASVEGNTRFGDRENSQITLHMSGANPIPDEYALLQNYPNPFNAGTVIPFTMKDASDWTLTVYNIMGQTVQTFAGYDAPGTVRVNWNGLDHNGTTVPSGVYFYRVTTATWSATKKMTLLK